MYERGGGSQSVKPTCSTCGKKNFEKCLVGTNESFGYGKNDHKVRYCPTIESRGREAKQVPPNSPDVGAPKRNRFYCLQAKANPDEEIDKL